MTDETSTPTETEDAPQTRTRSRSRSRTAATPEDAATQETAAPKPRTTKRGAGSGAKAGESTGAGEGSDVEVLAAAEVVEGEGDDEGEGLGGLIRRRRRRGGRGRGRGGRGRVDERAADGAGGEGAAGTDEPAAPAGDAPSAGPADGAADTQGADEGAEPAGGADGETEGADAAAGGSRTRSRTRSRRTSTAGDEEPDATSSTRAKGGRGRAGQGSGGGRSGGAESGPRSGAKAGGDRSAGARSSDRKPADKSGDSGGAKADEERSGGGTRSKGGGQRAKGDGGGGQGKGTTRLQARNRGRSSSSGGRGRGKGGGRRPLGGVSEETRRAITEGPPRKMLVNFGDERTQVAVLEERTLVEHYVTRKEDVSYVGNIYLGRVQNVLPGMEAAFVDIGKGRNGVLYAGEVNYDEADLEGDLPRIEDHVKPGQTVLVQVTKDPMGTKGARLTQHLSIAGRYCVLAPGDDMLGISRKLTDEERDRLRKILKSIKPDDFGLIVRTAAEGATQEQLEADVSRLTRIWGQVQKRSKEVKPLDAVYEEPHLVMRVIRDIFGTEFSHLVVDSEEMADQIKEYLSDVSPEMVDKVEVHTGEEDIFDAYEVTTQVRRALEKKVWLKSGGYLIIEKTEAMWVIDVNTGKFVGKDNLEETVLKNNLESADEIARQLRLRDMGGIIVIDFVDMLVPANRDEVLKRFKRELARDKTKSRVMDISKLGLVQMTRKNVSQGLTETFTTTCDTCEGRGRKILDHAFH